MSRFLCLSLALLSLSVSASAQEVHESVETAPAHTHQNDPWGDGPVTPAVDTSGEPTPFQFSLSVGFGTTFSSIHEELVLLNGGADVPDAIGFAGSLTLGRIASHKQFAGGLQFTLIPSYRASVDLYLVGNLDTGFIHRHEFSLGIGINRRVVVGLGGGGALLHQGGEMFAGVAAHLDLRVGFANGMFIGLPLNITVLMDLNTIVLTTLAIELGWQSLR